MTDALLIILGTLCGAGAVWASRLGMDRLRRQRRENNEFKTPMAFGQEESRRRAHAH
jgi:hypothetical protein